MKLNFRFFDNLWIFSNKYWGKRGPKQEEKEGPKQASCNNATHRIDKVQNLGKEIPVHDVGHLRNKVAEHESSFDIARN